MVLFRNSPGTPTRMVEKEASWEQVTLEALFWDGQSSL